MPVLVLVLEKSSAPLPRSPGQNSCGKMEGPLLGADGRSSTSYHKDEHGSPNLTRSVDHLRLDK